MRKRKLGQHFLRDPIVAEREVEYAEVSKEDVVLEIGPGWGILTKKLAEHAKKVIAIEIDDLLVSHLKVMMPSNVTVIKGDAVEIDFSTIPPFNKIVSNIPFRISSPITFKLIKQGFDKAVLMYQKEFAERMIAKPGDENYSRLSVAVYYKTYAKILEKVPRGCFTPPPRVDCCLVELIPREKPPFEVVNEEFFFNLTRELFNHRRKKIRQTLKLLYDRIPNDTPFQDNRVEELKPEEIGVLANHLYEKHGDIFRH
ncbi:MAG TPA: ribosomal RNA small subunit methyltransferase A [Thermoplasmatales archaeon]|nr:ribosomal RNA small subunit methyltransferase A [Thermoplasmatales archaeon]